MICELFEENIRIESDLYDSDLLQECFKIRITISLIYQSSPKQNVGNLRGLKHARKSIGQEVNVRLFY